MSALDVRVFESLQTCAPIRADMARVNDASPRPCPFSTLEFLANHVEHNGIAPGCADARPLMLTAFRGGELVGYLPLCRVRDRVLGRAREKITYLVKHDLDRPHLVARQDDQAACAEAFYRNLVESERDWTFLELDQQDEGSPLYPLPPSVDTDGLYLRLFESTSNATIAIPYATLADYFRALSKKMRSNVGRGARRLFDAGDVQIVASSGAAMGDGWLDLYRSIEERSWKSGIDWVVGSDPRRIAYFRGLMSPGQPMGIRFILLVSGGVPIAGIINGRFGGGMHALQIAYDEGFRELDPGGMMLLVSMKQAIEERCAYYDLLSGYGYFKERWLARITPSRNVQLFRRGSLHHLKAIGGEYRRHLLGLVDPQAGAKKNLAKAAKVAGEGAAEEEGGGRGAADPGSAAAGRAEAARMLAELRGSGAAMQIMGKDELMAAMPFAAGR